ncbi:hypothetical protein I603_1601 [Erythrobacter dokdonensis DSW-74]|uniref:Uncharacterized protein n=1 Tax=Erythrobacter dokdonensis DSW-74 TaxID=1300349 RepID=A0A1A7BF90_9SPHN|nr:hypothetical protein I603_1601 [Erythrobacter dokdonensis DSW-74]
MQNTGGEPQGTLDQHRCGIVSSRRQAFDHSSQLIATDRVGREDGGNSRQSAYPLSDAAIPPRVGPLAAAVALGGQCLPRNHRRSRRKGPDHAFGTLAGCPPIVRGDWRSWFAPESFSHAWKHAISSSETSARKHRREPKSCRNRHILRASPMFFRGYPRDCLGAATASFRRSPDRTGWVPPVLPAKSRSACNGRPKVASVPMPGWYMTGNW